MRFLRWDWRVEMEPDDQPFCKVRGCLRIWDLVWTVELGARSDFG